MNEKTIVRALCCILSLLCALSYMCAAFVYDIIPDTVTVSDNNENIAFSRELGIIISDNSKNTAGAAYDTKLSHNQKSSLMLFGIIPVKQVEVERNSNTVIVGGKPFGLEIFSKGVMVVGTMTVETMEGWSVDPSQKAGIKTGDIVLKINGDEVSSNADISRIVGQSGGNPLEFLITREGRQMNLKLIPVKSADGKYRAGIWVRDSSAGIGTMTFFDETSGVLAGLGHAVCDVDTGGIIPISSGQMFSAVIDSVKKGQKGTAGQLIGHMISSNPLGELYINCSIGVYASSEGKTAVGERVNVLSSPEISPGPAQILTTVSGDTPELYDCVIETVNYSSKSSNKDMAIRITDQRLLDTTGGIVQGMSGSPVLVNGELAGAVTHVFVNDPTKGYAVFACRMLSMARSNGEFEDEKAAS